VTAGSTRRQPIRRGGPEAGVYSEFQACGTSWGLACHPEPMRRMGCRPWIAVPLFRPDEQVLSNLRALSVQAPVVAVDDGSPSSCAGILREIDALPGVDLLRGAENKGIAAALNKAVAAASIRGATLLIFFDQDSVPAPDYVQVACEIFNEGITSAEIGALGPWDQNPRIGGDKSTAEDFVERRALIQSGMVVPACWFHTHGQFDESLFIDGVDTEFCLRLRSAGLWVGATPRLKMEHRLGVGSDSYRYLWFGPFRPTATFHSADRRYYINRNMVHLLRRFGRSEPRWAAVHMRRTSGNNLAALVLEGGKRSKVAAIFAGLWDGLRGRYGPRLSRH
jgi:rhamnosyltransferase